MQGCKFALVVAAGFWICSPLVQAGSLTSGASHGSLHGVSFGGTVIADTHPRSFSWTGTAGVVDEVVLAGDPLNPFHGLDFVYEVQVQKGSFAHLTVSDYAGSRVNSSQAFAFGSFLPLSPIPVPFTSEAGGLIRFEYGALAIGPFSDLEILRTNAQHFQQGTICLDGAEVATLDGYGPVVQAPEPATLVSAGLAIVGLTGYRVRRGRMECANPVA